MSDHVPFDLQVEIIKRLPAKSLLKFRVVSKPWKSLIDSAEFIADYNPQTQHLFIHSCSEYNRRYIHKCFSIIDDDTFPQHKVSPTVPSSLCVNMSIDLIVYSHGLFCFFFGYYNPKIQMAVIWNPSIRKSVDVVVPSLLDTFFLGFGVCRDTNDPKIVKINEIIKSDLFTFEVEVFSLSSGLWRKSVSKLPDKRCYLKRNPVVIDGIIYWFATYVELDTIISFDLTTEELKPVYLPDKLAFDVDKCFCYRPIYKLRESLVVVKYEFNEGGDKEVYEVWMMENSVSKLFRKIFTFNFTYASLRIIHGFRNNGELIMEIEDDDDYLSSIL